MKSLFALWSLVAMAWLVPAAYAQTQYNVIPLPDIEGHAVVAVDLNENGQVLCRANGHSYIFEYEQYRDLGIPEGMENFAAYCLNNTGHVAGFAFDELVGWHPYLWHETTGFQPLTADFFDIAEVIFIGDMNDSLQIIGYISYYIGQQLYGRAFVWQNGEAEDLGDLGNTGANYPEAINNLGQIVGHAFDQEAMEFRAFLWQEGVMTNLGALGGTGESRADDINDAGSIVGAVCNEVEGQGCRSQGYLYFNGAPLPFDTGDAESVARWVNVHNEVLVEIFYSGEVYLWREGFLYDLNSAFESPPGVWAFAGVDGFNDRGEILWRARGANGEERNWLLKPGGVLHPSSGELVISGTEDAIRWQVPEDMGYLYIELNTHAEDEPDRYVPVGNAPPQVGQLSWTVPDSFSTQCRIRLFSPGHPDTIYSGLFRMKPLMLTRLDEEGDYVPWTMGRDNWSQGNNDDAWWPESWWVGNPEFDYEDGVDPISGREYPDFPWPNAFAFDTAEASVFPDWPLFVQTFGQAQSYDNVAAGTYNPTALWNWYCQRGDWRGSCSGMAYSSLMFFRDPEAMRERFPALASYENLPDDPLAADDIRVMVNQFQCVQSGADQAALTRERIATMTPRDVVQILEEEFARDEPFVIAPLGLYNYESGGAHAVVPFKITTEHAGADSTWNIYTYDPNLGDESSFVRVRKQSGETEWSWRTIVNDSFWGGTRIGLMLDLPADLEYGESVQMLPFYSGGGGGKQDAAGRERETWSQDFTVFTSARGSLALTASDRPGMAGHVDGQPVSDLPGVTPLYSKTSVIGPPNSYLISGDYPQAAYTFAMGEGADAERVLGVFRGDASVCYLRAPGDSTATDLVSFNRGGAQIGVAAMGTPGTPKTITLTTIAQEFDHQKVWMVSEVTLSEGDSIRVVRAGSEEIRILNAGPDPRTCTLGLERASALDNPQFMAAGIEVPAGSSLRVVPNWFDLAESPVLIEVDLGDDGSVDETVEVANELDDPATSVAPGGPPTSDFRFSARALDSGKGGVLVQGSVPVDCHLKVRVYDMRGRNLGTIFDGPQRAGDFTLSRTLQDGRGGRPASGIYFVRVEAAGPDGRVLHRGAQKFLVMR